MSCDSSVKISPLLFLVDFLSKMKKEKQSNSCPVVEFFSFRLLFLTWLPSSPKMQNACEILLFCIFYLNGQGKIFQDIPIVVPSTENEKKKH